MPAVKALVGAAWREMYRNFLSDDRLNALLARLQSPDGIRLVMPGIGEQGIVARDGSSLAGIIVFRLSRSVLEIHHLYVDAASRSRGLGRQLIQHAVSLCDKADAARVQVVAGTPAVRFYEHLGFKKSGSRMINLGEQDFQEVMTLQAVLPGQLTAAKNASASGAAGQRADGEGTEDLPLSAQIRAYVTHVQALATAPGASGHGLIAELLWLANALDRHHIKPRISLHHFPACRQADVAGSAFDDASPQAYASRQEIFGALFDKEPGAEDCRT